MVEIYDFRCREFYLLEGVYGETSCVQSLHLHQVTVRLISGSVNRLMLVNIEDVGK